MPKITPSITAAFRICAYDAKLKHVLNKGFPPILLPVSNRSMIPIRGTSMWSNTARQNSCMWSARLSNCPLPIEENLHRVGSNAEKHPTKWALLGFFTSRYIIELPKVSVSVKLSLVSYPPCLLKTTDQADARVAKTLRSRMFEHFLSAIANSFEMLTLMLPHGLFLCAVVVLCFAISLL